MAKKNQHKRNKSCPDMGILDCLPKLLVDSLATPRKGFYIPKIDKTASLVLVEEGKFKQNFDTRKVNTEFFDEGMRLESKEDVKEIKK